MVVPLTPQHKLFFSALAVWEQDYRLVRNFPGTFNATRQLSWDRNRNDIIWQFSEVWS